MFIIYFWRVSKQILEMFFPMLLPMAFEKNKTQFLPSSDGVDIAIWMHYIVAN